MKTVRVAAAVICDARLNPTRVFATARGYGPYAGHWEFPGGKLEPGETAVQALQREIGEELDTQITVHDRIATVEHDYPTFHLSMECFRCTVAGGSLTLREASASAWLTADALDGLQWLPADRAVLDDVRALLQGGGIGGAADAGEKVRVYFDAWLNKNPAPLPELFAADAVYTESYGPQYRSLAEIQRWFDDWNARGTVTQWDIRRLIRQGNTVAVEWYFACVYDGEAGAFDGVSVVEFDAEGKICALREYQSKAEHVHPYRETREDRQTDA